MPLYEYACKRCKSNFEVLQRFSDPPVRRCPSCEGAAERKVSRTSFQLKGSGWYKDGYATPAPAKTEGKKTEKAPSATPATQSKKKED